MTQREKLLERLRNNRWNVRFEEIDRLLKDYGFAVRQGNHYVYSRGKWVITVNHHKPIVHSKAVKEVLDAISAILEAGA